MAEDNPNRQIRLGTETDAAGIKKTLAGAVVTPEPAGGKNAAAIARVRRRYAWVCGFFWFFTALMPLGCILSFWLSNLYRSPHVSGGLMVAGLLLPFVGLGGVILMLKDRYRYSRALALAQKAEKMGWRYDYRPPPERTYRLKKFRSFRHADDDLGENLLEGTVAGFLAMVLDFTVITGGKPNSPSSVLGFGGLTSNIRQTVLVIPSALPGVPDFVACPKSWTARFGQLFGSAPISLPNQPEFNRLLILNGQARDAVASQMSPELIGLLLSEPTLSVEVQEGDLLVYGYKKLARPEQIETLMGHAAALVERLRAK